MEAWRAYIDESYSTKTFCVGGFPAPEAVWALIGSDWSQRIEYERRFSINRGFRPISRYHATDCAHLKRDFSETNGSDIPRQIRLTKRLCEILGKHTPTGIVVGGGLGEVQRYLPPDSEEANAFLYTTCFKMCLLNIASLMREYVYEPRVRVFYERGKFEPLAKEAFEMFRNEKSSLFRCIVSAEPKGWESCIPLQTADFTAYQGFLRVDGSLGGQRCRSKIASSAYPERYSS
jgi:hypothetical protein